MTKRAIVYARVSTDDQADRGFSLSAQVEAGHKYAEAHGMTVTNELIDDGVSGAMAFSERPAGATAWKMLRQHQADALVVQNVDRLSRDVVDLLVTIRELLRAGVEVHCLDLGRVTSEYDIMLVIRGWQGSDEREKIKKRSMRGKRAKLAQGMIVGGRLPYGYEHLRDERGRVVNFTVNEEQAEVVRLIFQWYTIGDGKSGPLAQYAIAKRLTGAGIPTPSARHNTGVWTMTHVSRIVKNSIYKGEWVYTANATDEAPEQTFTIAVPAIVDPETWGLAQVQKERNVRKAKRNGKHDYLLTGIIQCGSCGYNMAGNSPEGGARVYYRCNTKSFRARKANCAERHIRAEPLEAAVWDAILNVMKNPTELEAKLREAQRRELAEQEPQRAELETVNAMLAEAQTEADNLAMAFARLVEREQADGAVGRALQEKMNAVDERYKRLTARRDALEVALANRRLTDDAIAGMLAYAAKIEIGISHATNEDKRRVLDAFDARVIVKGGKAQLEYDLDGRASIDLHLRQRK